MPTIRKILCASLIALAPAVVRAQTVDFEDVASGGCASLGHSMVSRGYTFTANDGFWGCGANMLQHNTSNAIVDANSRSDFLMSRVGGGTFSLNSFFAGGRAGYPPDAPQTYYTVATGLKVTGSLFGGGIVTQTFALDAVAPYDWSQYFLSPSFDNLVSARFTALGDGPTPEFLIDDIATNGEFGGGDGAVAPEPATMLLLASGLAGLGGFGAIRRRRIS